MPAFIKAPGPTRPSYRLVLIWHGTGYGNRDYVAERIRSMMEKPSDDPERLELPPDVLLVVSDSHVQRYPDLLDKVEAFLASDPAHPTFTPAALVGWSGGSYGLSKAVGLEDSGVWRDHRSSPLGFPRVLYADPSPGAPALQAPTDPRVHIWYQPDNWRGSNSALGPKLQRVAEKWGTQATLVPYIASEDRGPDKTPRSSHNRILDMTIRAAVPGPAVTARPVPPAPLPRPQARVEPQPDTATRLPPPVPPPLPSLLPVAPAPPLEAAVDWKILAGAGIGLVLLLALKGP